MVRALAIETSGRIGSIALAEDGGVVAEREFPHGLQHAAHIIPIIDELCRERSWTPGQIDHVYVSAGPGSFTGLRIGITLAKTLWLATGVKVVAVPTVRVLAENAPADARTVVIVLDAKRDQIYTARFERGGVPGIAGKGCESSVGRDASPSRPGAPQSGGFAETAPSPATVASPQSEDAGIACWDEVEAAHLDTLAAMLSRSGRPVHLVGDWIPFHEKFIPKDDGGIVVTAADTWRARAGVVARLGWEMAGRGQFADPMKLTPIYVRLPEAEEKYLAGKR